MYDVAHDYTIAREERAGKERDKNFLARDSCGIPGRPENYVDLPRRALQFSSIRWSDFSTRRGTASLLRYSDETRQAERKRAREQSAEPGQVSWPLNACVVSQFFPFFFFVAGCRHRRTTERVRRTAPHIGALPGESNFACDRQNP